jgi:hypothetical protein
MVISKHTSLKIVKLIVLLLAFRLLLAFVLSFVRERTRSTDFASPPRRQFDVGFTGDARAEMERRRRWEDEEERGVLHYLHYYLKLDCTDSGLRLRAV